MLENTAVTEQHPDTNLGRQLEIVSRLIKAHGILGVERDAFYVTLGGFGTHGDVIPTLNNLFTTANDAIESFALEMKNQGECKIVLMLKHRTLLAH